MTLTSSMRLKEKMKIDMSIVGLLQSEWKGRCKWRGLLGTSSHLLCTVHVD